MTTLSFNRSVGVGSRNEAFGLLSESNWIEAGAGDDYVTGSGYPDFPNGTDYVVGGLGDDVVNGSKGDDVLFGDGIAADAADGADFLNGGTGGDVIFAGGGSDFVTGDDSFSPAGNRADHVDGGAGDDTLWGYFGADTVHGGAGNDLIHGHSPPLFTAMVRTQSWDYDGQTDAASPGTLGERVVSTGADDEAPDLLDGGDGDDSLSGGDGTDILLGGRGDDQVTGGAGHDWLDGGAGFDYARYDHAGGFAPGVVVRLDVGVGLGGDAQDDVLLGIEGLIGTDDADFLIGAGDANVLYGQSGSDWLFGQGGADILYGGHFNDQVIGGAGSDLLFGEADNDQFWFLAADLEPGVVDYVLDFGEAQGNFDYLRFEGVDPAALTFTDGDGYVLVTSAGVPGGGIYVFGMTAAAIADQVIYA